jgi:hypothetical protein
MLLSVGHDVDDELVLVGRAVELPEHGPDHAAP